jgi:predicted transcriptional regulator
MGKRITEEQKAEIVRLVQGGELTQKEIAEIVEVSVAAVKKYGFPEEEIAVEEEASGPTVEDYLMKVIEAKDAHIASLEKVNDSLIAALTAKAGAV